MNFLDIITERGFVHQLTDEVGLRALLQTPASAPISGSIARPNRCMSAR